jgi:hypothetical protein
MPRSLGLPAAQRNSAADPFKPRRPTGSKTGGKERAMSQSQVGIRGFKAIFTTLGSIYALMAGSMLARGTRALLEFGISERLIREPVFEDFFLFFYQLMLVIGVLIVLFGHVVREHRSQLLVAGIFTALNVLTALRDLVTSNSRFGNHLYSGRVLVFVYISLAYAVVFGFLVVRGLMATRARQPAT